MRANLYRLLQRVVKVKDKEVQPLQSVHNQLQKLQTCASNFSCTSDVLLSL